MVGRWVTASKGWDSELNQNSKRIGSGQKAFYPEAEEKLYTWLIEQRKQGLAVTYTILRIKMQNILKEREMITLYGGSAKEFKTSCQWISSFMKRYKLSWRRRTKISQKLPRQTEETLAKFHQFINNLRTRKSFDLCNIFNMDKPPVWFNMVGNFTIDQKGEKTVQIRSTGNDKNRFTVVLTCAADNGTKLPPICIFKGKRLSKGEKIPPGVVVWFQDKGWMDSELMNRYIDYLGDKINKRTGARAPSVIPCSLTSLCQPLDVAINKPFKANLLYILWMAAGGAGQTNKGNLRRAKFSDVCAWVKCSWDGISDEIIIDSFKTCGISNALDEVEDFDNEIIDISNDDLEDDNLEHDVSDDNLEDDISCDDSGISINE
ncbi:pogo transposable element with KRAB domain [Rhizophagus irregularis DAOM 181602=DAOM 197198]|nr:pogo transposable element with KRAB domain [Rhizophagus irregularis DAOM 181602=DAOM 197198]